MDSPTPVPVLGIVVGLTFVILVITTAYILPIYYGLKWAKQSKMSALSLWWFALHPLFGWIVVGVMRWRIIDTVGNSLVKPISGKVACDICGDFNSINNSFCPKCAAPIQKPLCPNCGQNETQFVGKVWNNIGIGFLLIAFAGVPINAVSAASPGGDLTILGALFLFIAGGMCVAGTIYILKPFSRSSKQIKCLSCGVVSLMTAVGDFEQVSTDESRQTLRANFEQKNAALAQRKADLVQKKLQSQLQEARDGKFDCKAYENAHVIQGTVSYVYGQAKVALNVQDDGLHFSPLLFWRSNASAATLGSVSRIPTLVGVVALIASTETRTLFIPWNEIKEYAPIIMPRGDGKKLLIFFKNIAKHQLERIELSLGIKEDGNVLIGIDKVTEEEILEIFLDHCMKRNIQFKQAEMAALPTGLSLKEDHSASESSTETYIWKD